MLLRADVTLSLGKEASPRDSCAWRSCYPTRDIAAQPQTSVQWLRAAPSSPVHRPTVRAPRTPAQGPLLQHRETRYTDGFPVREEQAHKYAA